MTKQKKRQPCAAPSRTKAKKMLDVESCRRLGFDRAIEDLEGQKFGKLTVIENLPKPELDQKNRNRRVLVKCNCGTTPAFEARVDNLRSGETSSCGCGWKSHVQKWRSTKLTNPPKNYKKMAAAE